MVYTCDATIEPVANAFLKEHSLGTNFSRYVPPAIALQGYGSPVVGFGNDTTNYQFQSYPVQTYFGEPAHGQPGFIASKIARFAINAVAALRPVQH